ncbi:AI-2E family transporter [cf. Phormidesmis sp. LEGE 11477]|uniref:AI-2E family transporter n=1 Tax=cf. Phormidesmis sp. LEGE 11477 TaxID=1828680 RepID=UPI00187DF368|nr:AI-2E family transporter [cf. Phormidesmis sp. LEGE 11477]MBE9061800.1 AI-2E family transporter [cf. Phormidesmis sp. LEGE 11477]
MEDHPLWKHLTTSSLLRYLLLFVCGWAAVELLEYFETVVVIFTASAILAFLLSHPVHWLRRFLPHGVAVSIVFVIALTVIGGLATTITLVLLSQSQPLIDNLSDFLTTLTPQLEALEQLFQRWNLPVDLQSLGAQFRDQAIGLLGLGVNLLQGLVNNFLHSVLVAVVTLFMLLDGARLWHFLIKRLSLEQQMRVTETVQDSFLGFFWGRLLLSIFFGVSTFVVFLLLGVPYAPTLAVIAGLFDLIPGIGATLGVSLISLFLLSQSLVLAVQSVVICVVLQQVEENLLLPRIMKDSLNINPVVMFFALIVGARIAGFLGIFLSIPIASTIINLLEIDEMKGSAALSSSDSAAKSDATHR